MLKKLNEAFPDWLTGSGIFAALQSFAVPWQSDNIADLLDMEYFGNVSGGKRTSPLIRAMLGTEEELTDSQRTQLAGIIFRINGVNWSKLWDTLSFQYDPISNYDMTETMTDDETVSEYGKSTTHTNNLTDTRTDNLTYTKDGTETETKDLTDQRTDNLTHTKEGTETQTPLTTETTTPNLTTTKDDGVFGFNSGSASGANTSETNATGTNTVSKTGTDTMTYDLEEKNTGTETTKHTGTDDIEYDIEEKNTGTQTTTKTGTLTDADTGSDTTTRNYTLTRSGNIGVTTSQQMIESERNLWKWNFFRDVVFPDIDTTLTIRIY